MEHLSTRSEPSGIQVDISINVEEIDIESIEFEEEKNVEVEEEIFGNKVGLFSRIFGCKHRRMSKPVTTKYVSYKYCPTCGIRRRYDLEAFESVGNYYYPAHNKELHHV